MQVDLQEVVKEYKKLFGQMHYELLTHKLAVDVLEREVNDLRERLYTAEAELARRKNESAAGLAVSPIPPLEGVETIPMDDITE